MDCKKGKKRLHYKTKAESQGNEEEFDRNPMSSEHVLAKNNRFIPSSCEKCKEKNLQPWNIGEEDSNSKSDKGGKKDRDILRWRVLEHAQSAASSCEQVTNGDVMKKWMDILFM